MALESLMFLCFVRLFAQGGRGEMATGNRIQTGFTRIGLLLAAPAAVLGAFALLAALAAFTVATYTQIPSEPTQRAAFIDVAGGGPSVFVTAPKSATDEDIISFAEGKTKRGEGWTVSPVDSKVRQPSPVALFQPSRFTYAESIEQQNFDNEVRRINNMRARSSDLATGGGTALGFAVLWYYFCVAVGWVIAGFFV